MANNFRIVTIGGGTGSFTLLSGLKKLTPEITAIVSMVDDGKSTGQLRDELGVLPPGDVRQCLVALSRSSKIMRQLFNYRFEEGSLKDHSFGNLLLSALEKTTGNFAEAVEAASEILNIVGKVVPVTLENTRLALRYKNGEIVEHESAIDVLKFKNGERPKMFLDPLASLNPEAASAISRADVVVIAPGSLHTSLIPTLLINGMPEALAQTKAKKLYVCNLVTTAGQTDGYQVSDFVSELESYGGEEFLDYVLYNNTQPPSELTQAYAAEHEYWVEFDNTTLNSSTTKAIGDSMFSASALKQHLIRHDGVKVAKHIMELAE